MDLVDAMPELPSLDRSTAERTTLIEMLDYYRAVLERKTHGLDDEQLATPLPPSDLTLGGLILHMAVVEDSWLHERFAGNGEPEPWASAPWDDDRDWELHIAARWTRDELIEQFATSLARSRAAVASAPSLDQESVVANPDGTPCSLRWILVHLIEEYARHCGHADYIRQSIDGVTGD